MDSAERRQIVQDISRDILKDIIAFCNKHGIEYFMFFGSLLGTIRHQGIIPWDDDIDITMTRENYCRFIECAKSDGKEFLAKNEMIINGSGSIKYVSELKIGRRGTIYCPKMGMDLDINKQITVDIFCTDHLKGSYVKNIQRNNMIRLFFQISKQKWDEKRYLMRVFKHSTSPFKNLRIISLLFMHILRFLIGEKGIESIVYKMAVDKTGNSTYMGIVCGIRRPIYFSSGFKLKTAKFDGLDVLIPDNYDEILTEIYGDYMQLPPENERIGLDKFEVVLEVNPEYS